jgi:cysteine synthase
MSVVDSALGLIGNTPLIALDRLHRGPGRILAKAEFVQPGGSIKDRAALTILKCALRDGRLKHGQPVVEMTSGNMGSGLAVVCAVLGNPFIATISEGNSPQRVRILEGLGADVHLVPQTDGTPGQVTGTDIASAVEAAKVLAQKYKGFYVDQFHNPDSIRAHREGTGPEIWHQSGGRLDAFVTCVGTGGTFIGVSRVLKSHKRSIVCAAVEPEGSEVLAGKAIRKPRHLLQGTGYGLVPPHWDPALMDLSIAVTDEEATEYGVRLAREEGLYTGYSSGANVAAAVKLLHSGQLGSHATVVTILCDSGMKY